MSIRRCNDSVKPGCGIDGSKGENFTHGAVGSWNQQSAHKERPNYPGAYSTNDSGLRNKKDFGDTAATRDIWNDVQENDGPNGGYSAAIRAGVNKSQE